jgi:ribosome modulation factor
MSKYDAYNDGYHAGIYGGSKCTYYDLEDIAAWTRGFKAGRKALREEAAAQEWAARFNTAQLSAQKR